MTPSEHLAHVRQLLQRCKDQGITLNPAKFKFARRRTKFGGFVLSKGRYTPDPVLYKPIREFPVPVNLTDLRSFQGLINQIAPFNQEVADKMLPLRPLLSQKNEFVWAPEHQSAFEQARAALSSPATLAFYDPPKPTSLHTDASRLKGLGFVLRQRQEDGTWRVVQCGSRFLSKTESRYAVIELELLGLCWATKKCQVFLEGLQQFQFSTTSPSYRS